jgi:hypothetical protein
MGNGSLWIDLSSYLPINQVPTNAYRKMGIVSCCCWWELASWWAVSGNLFSLTAFSVVSHNLHQSIIIIIIRIIRIRAFVFRLDCSSALQRIAYHILTQNTNDSRKESLGGFSCPKTQLTQFSQPQLRKKKCNQYNNSSSSSSNWSDIHTTVFSSAKTLSRFYLFSHWTL